MTRTNTKPVENDDIIEIFMKIEDDEFIKAVLWVEYKRDNQEVRKPVLEACATCM